MSDIETDCLLAVTGLLPDKVTLRERASAKSLPDLFAKRAKEWWAAEERTPYKDLTTPNLDKLFDQLASPPMREEVQAWLVAAGDEMDDVDGLYIALTKARKYLVDKWPRIVIPTFAGDRLMPLAVDDAAEVTSLWAVLDDPVRVLDEMDSATLTPSQAEAFRANYSALYETYRDALSAHSAEHTRKDPNWIPTEQQEIALAILTGQPSGVADYKATSGDAQPPKAAEDLGANNAETQLDKTSKPKGTK